MTTVRRMAQTLAAVDRKVHVGHGRSLGNLYAWEQVIESPAAGFTFYFVDLNKTTGLALAGGGDGSSGPRLWRRDAWDGGWKEITDRLPADATGDLRHGVFAGAEADEWWLCGENLAGDDGWLAFSDDYGETWTSWSSFVGVDEPLYALRQVGGAAMYIGGGSGFLKLWVAPGGVIDLSASLGWSERIRYIDTLYGAGVMVVGGDSPVATETCAYTANGGASWTDRTAALGASGPVHCVKALSEEWLVGGDDVFSRSGDNGANWDDWRTPVLEPVMPVYTFVGRHAKALVGAEYGVFSVFAGGLIVNQLPVKAVEQIRYLAFVYPEVMVCGTDVWSSARGSTVAMIPLTLVEVRGSPSKWVHVDATDTVVYRGACVLTSLVASTAVSDTVTIYDNTAASGTELTFMVGAGESVPIVFASPLKFENGVTVSFGEVTTRVLVGYVG